MQQMSPGGYLGAAGEFCGAFFWRMSFETCPKSISLAVLGRLLLTLSYFGWGVGLSRFDRQSDTQYFRAATKAPGGYLGATGDFFGAFFLKMSF